MSGEFRELARRLRRLEEGVKAQNVPQLAHSSVENGAIEHYDADGQLTAIVGRQHDDTVAPVVVTGPTPPAPTGLSVTGGQLQVTASWNGTWEGDAVAPMDFARVEVHTGTSQDFEVDPLPMSLTRVATIESPGGASVTWQAEPGEVWVTIVARTLPGKVSEHRELVMVEVEGAVDPTIFERARADIEQAKTDIVQAISGPVDVERINAEQMAAKVGLFVKVGVNQLVVTDTATFDTAVAQRMFVDIFAARKITGGEIDAQKVSGAIGEFVKVKAENIQAGFINSALGLGTLGAIWAGDLAGAYARMDKRGFSVWGLSPDGTQYQSTSLGSGADNSLTIADANGVPSAAISANGDFSGNTFTSAGEVRIAGADLIGQRLPYAGSSGASWLDTLPWGLAGVSNLGQTVAGKSVTAATTEVITPLQVVTATVWPGRTYRVWMPFAYYANGVTSGQVALMGARCYYTVGTQAAPVPDDPTTNSSSVGYAMRAYASSMSGPIADVMSLVITPTVDAGGPVTMKLLVASGVKNATMAYSVPVGGSWLLTVEDVGPRVEDAGYAVGGATKNTYVSQWKASVSRSFDKAGNDSNVDYQQGILRHGGDTSTHSAFVCNGGAISGEKGKTIAQALSGATVTKVEVGLQSLYWARSTGGYVTLLPGTGTSVPASDPNPGDPKSGVDRSYTARSQWQWTSVPTSWVTPSNTGVRIGPSWVGGDYNKAQFANHNHPAAPPQIRITYTR